MLIKPEIQEKYREIEVHVCNHEMDGEVKKIVEELRGLLDSSLTGTDERGNRCVLKPAQLYAFYAQGQRVLAMDEKGTYTVSKKLYELEEELPSSFFVRISKSEIVNYHRIKSLDMSVTGTIRIVMKNGYETFASRRNVARLKELLVK